MKPKTINLIISTHSVNYDNAISSLNSNIEEFVKQNPNYNIEVKQYQIVSVYNNSPGVISEKWFISALLVGKKKRSTKPKK